MVAESKTVQNIFIMLAQLTLQFMSYYTNLFSASFFDRFTNRFWNPVIITLSCNMNYYFDYLEEKSIFFDETKNAE